MPYTFDRRLGRYRDTRGRLIAERVVRDAVDNVTDLASSRMGQYARDLLDGRLSLADFQARLMQDSKSAHLAAGIAAHGGKAQMSPSDWGRVGQQVRRQYGYLRNFAASVVDGRQPLNGTLVSRAQQYGQAARVTYEAIKAADDKARGMTVERNVLHGRDHCGECPKLTAKGWVPIGSLKPIGSRECRVHDRCSIERRFAVPKSSKVA
jgi:hypothetical protein